MNSLPPKFPLPFEVRGEIGLLCGTATIWPDRLGWFVAGIRLHGATPASPDRSLAPDDAEFGRLANALARQEGKRIDAAIATAKARRAA